MFMSHDGWHDGWIFKYHTIMGTTAFCMCIRFIIRCIAISPPETVSITIVPLLLVFESKVPFKNRFSWSD